VKIIRDHPEGDDISFKKFVRMKFSIMRSFFLLGVACSGLGYIFSVYAKQDDGFILGDFNESQMTLSPSLNNFQKEGIARRDEKREDSDSDRRQKSEPRIIQEIVIPKAIKATDSRSEEKPATEKTTVSEKKAETREAKIDAVKEGEADNEIKNNTSSRQGTSAGKSGIAINASGEVRISTEVDVEEHEGIRDAGFYSRGSSGQESYLGRGTETSKGKFEYKNDLSKQLSNGEHELVFKSTKEKIGSKGEKVVSEEIKSIPVVVNVRDDEHDLQVREETKKQLIEELKRSGADALLLSKIESVAPDKIALVKEAESKDFDQDGISNLEERNRGTDPFLADSDNDGYLDGDEVKRGYDPKKFSPGDGRDKIVFENPKDIVEKERKNPETKTVDARYQVDAVEIVKADSPAEKDKLRFSGKALPNIFITLYIYSEPTVVTVKTDENGNWSYDLDKNVEDGDHQAYVAVTDNTGKITARSEGIGFVKTASAITVKPIAEAAEASVNNQSPLERSQTEYFLVAFIAILFFSGAALIVVSRKSSIDQR